MTDHCSPQSIEDELAIAHGALKEGDLGHAAFHIAAALVLQPNHAETLAVFDGWFAAADDPLMLVTKRDDEQWEGWVAMRVRSYAKLGREEEALPLLAALAAFAPHKPYLTWLPLIRDAGRVEDEVAVNASRTFLRLAASLSEPLAADDPARPNVDAALALLAEWRETKRQLPEPLHALTILLRKLGRTAEAVLAARALFELRADWHSAGTLSATLRCAGDLEAALAVAKRGAELAPPDARAATLLDMGDLSLELERPSEAREAYAAALELEPENAWASARVHYARFCERGEQADLAALRKFVVEHPDDAHARQLLSEIGEPILDQIILPSDATAAAFRRIHQSCLESPPANPVRVTLAVTAPESPSNRLAGEVMARAFGQRLELDLTVSAIPVPDPREPLQGAELSLWQRAGDSLEPAFETPDPSVQREVGVIAATPYNLAAWAERARLLGEALGPSRVRDLLATMVHPPPLPSIRFDAPLWVQNVQIASALTLANVDGGWDGSARRSALLSVARGPVDWTVTAAIVALMWISSHEPRAEKEIEALFQELRDRECHTAACTYDETLRQAWLRLPGIAPETRAMLQGDLAALTANESLIPTAPPSPSRTREGDWRVTAGAWAIGLTAAFIVPRIWPAPWGDWWLLASMTLVGVAVWIWARQFPPLQRGRR